MSILAQVFQDEGALDRLEAFTSLNGAAFYRMAPNEDRIRLTRRDTPAAYPTHISAGDETVTVFDPGFPLHWHLETA
jgi:dihydroorotase